MFSNRNKTAIYFRGLYIKDIKGFIGDFEIYFRSKTGSPVQWTVLLGNNNTGKTTILKLLASISYPNILSGYTDKYRQKYRMPFYEISNTDKRKKDRIESQSVFKWLNIDEKEIMIGPNLFFPFFDFSFFVRRVKNSNNIIDLDSLNRQNFTIESEYTFNLLKEYSESLIIFAYGIHRKISETNISDDKLTPSTSNLFEDTDLLNFEEWFLQTDYATRLGSEETKKKAEVQLKKIKEIIIESKILPDLKDIRASSTENLKSFVEIKSGRSWVKIKELGYGYQATIAWLTDLCKRMFECHSNLNNPLHGPAIVLVDEIDLHLHPEWQRKIIKYLSILFPNIQFIVTAHSPLIVQSAENINLVMLERDDVAGSINIRQQFGSFQGWTVEEILRELMDLGDKTRSDRFLELLKVFENGLDEGSYEKAKIAYDELDKILHPASSQRKLLSIQLSTLVPA
ncbi:AAA family ATPase [Larkinella terrae]|uniref:AAA family ATPase n=1 Tax=Larkinella terrae TaxID=2025311 RepID=A0A7K0EP75_9BACT|nr:AAA family ATPase [Larkinella terrae]MRS63522.1 AAA family ATPase [Larkinella terrae]